MSPTRREFLKTSAGAVALALTPGTSAVGDVLASQSDTVAEPPRPAKIWIDEISLITIQAQTSDGRMVTLASNPRNCQLSIMAADSLETEFVHDLPDFAPSAEFWVFTLFDRAMRDAGLTVSDYNFSRWDAMRKERKVELSETERLQRRQARRARSWKVLAA